MSLNRVINLLNLKLVIDSGLLGTRIFLARVTQIFVIDSAFKTSLWTYKIKDLNGEKIIRSFYEKE